jgi:hypothetical protein
MFDDRALIFPLSLRVAEGLFKSGGALKVHEALARERRLSLRCFFASFALKKHLSVGQSGTDVLKAIACGARAVFIGRPVLWGLATGSETGVRYVLEMVRQEFDLAMALSGCPTLSPITRDLIRRRG